MSLARLQAELRTGTSHLPFALPPMPRFETPLSDRFVRDLVRVKGAPEHEQIVRILVDAKGFRLDVGTTAELTALVRHHPATIERNLDAIRIPGAAVWIEYPDAPRRNADVVPIKGAMHPVNVGALVCVDEHDPNRLVVVTAWDFEDGSTRHSYAVAGLDLERLSQHAWLARNRFSVNPTESLTRMLDLVEITIPPGLATELQVLERADDPDYWEERYMERARGAGIDVSSEIPYVLAALIAIGTPQISTLSLGKGRPDLVHATPVAARRLPFVRRSPGFHRHGPKSAPRVDWVSTR